MATSTCRTPTCGLTYMGGMPHCCSACARGLFRHTKRCRRHQRFLLDQRRRRLTSCRLDGCARTSGLGHTTCCSKCGPTMGRDHTSRCNAYWEQPARSAISRQGHWNHESPHRVRGPASARNHSDTETPAVASGKRHEGAHPWMPWMSTGTGSSGCSGHAWGNFQSDHDAGTAATAASMAEAATPAGDSTTNGTYPSGRTDGSFDRANTVFSLTEMD